MTWQTEAIKAAGLTVGETADRLRVSWPKMTKAALSYALRPSETGITLLGSVSRALEVLTGWKRPSETGITLLGSVSRALEVLTGWKRPRRDKRRCPVRIQARLTEADARLLNRARETMGHATINDALVYALHLYIREAQKKAAGAEATATDGKTNNYMPSIRAER